MPDSTALVCDLTQAPDGPAERLTAYRRLFTALLTRVEVADGFRFVFDAATVNHELLERLVGLEAACCPFLRSVVSHGGSQVGWDVTADTEQARVFLDALRDLVDSLARAERVPDAKPDETPIPIPVRINAGPHPILRAAPSGRCADDGAEQGKPR